MSTERTIRAQARVKLRNRGYVKPLFGFAVVVIFYMLAEFTTYLFFTLAQIVFDLDSDVLDSLYFNLGATLLNILLLIFFSPILLGFIKMMYTDKKDYELSDIFSYFLKPNRYFKALGFIFSYIIRTFIPFVLLFSPVIALVVINLVFDQAIHIIIYKSAMVLLLVLSAIGYTVYCTKYFIAFKLFADDCTQKTGYYFSTSKLIMSGKCLKVIKLIFSFAPWLLLCITVLPILYVLPYFTKAMCLSGKWILELSRNGQEQ